MTATEFRESSGRTNALADKYEQWIALTEYETERFTWTAIVKQLRSLASWYAFMSDVTP